MPRVSTWYRRLLEIMEALHRFDEPGEVWSTCVWRPSARVGRDLLPYWHPGRVADAPGERNEVVAAFEREDETAVAQLSRGLAQPLDEGGVTGTREAHLGAVDRVGVVSIVTG